MTSTEAAPAKRVPDPQFGFPDRVRKSRLSCGATQREFAERLGVKHQTLAAWELGTTSCPRETAIAKRIEVLTGIRAAWVLGLDEPGPPPPAPLAVPADSNDGPRWWAGVDEGSTTRRKLGGKRHLVAVEALVDASPHPSPSVPAGCAASLTTAPAA